MRRGIQFDWQNNGPLGPLFSYGGLSGERCQRACRTVETYVHLEAFTRVTVHVAPEVMTKPTLQVVVGAAMSKQPSLIETPVKRIVRPELFVAM